MADNTITFKAELDSSELEKSLAELNKEIETLEEERDGVNIYFLKEE